jgi:hypothetical protein
MYNVQSTQFIHPMRMLDAVPLCLHASGLPPEDKLDALPKPWDHKETWPEAEGFTNQLTDAKVDVSPNHQLLALKTGSLAVVVPCV